MKIFTLKERKALTHDIFELIFDGESEIQMKPWQFITFIIDDIGGRAYSILEVDGREGDLLGGTDDNFTLTNGTIVASGGASITCDFKSKARGTVSNLNANGGQIKLSASFDTETLESEEDAAQNVIDGNLVFTTVNATFAIYTDDFDQ